jgi:surface polysaccharide O-acyltransferase-like enzyme
LLAAPSQSVSFDSLLNHPTRLNLSAVTPHVVPSGGKSAPQIDSLNLLRIVAAIAVVWIHVPESESLKGFAIGCRFAVPAFTAVSVFLMALSVREKSATNVIRYESNRAWGIYRLFLIWNAIYLSARVAKHFLLSGGDAIRLGFSTIFVAGLAEHLWYLPFIALLGFVMALPLRGFIQLKLVPAAAWSIGLLMAGVAASYLSMSIRVDIEHRPFSYFASLALGTLPAALFTFPVAWVWHQYGAMRRNYGASAVAIILAALCLAVSLKSSQASLWHNVSGILFLVAALFCSGAKLGDQIRSLGNLALPVYLIHVLLIEGIQAVGHRLHFRSSAVFDVTVFSLAACGSFLIAQLVAGIPRLAWLVSLRSIRRVQTPERVPLVVASE